MCLWSHFPHVFGNFNVWPKLTILQSGCFINFPNRLIFRILAIFSGHFLHRTIVMYVLSWLASPGNPTMSAHAEGKKGTCHNDIIYTVETREGGGGGNNPKTLLEVERRYNKHNGTTHMWITEDLWLHRLTNAGNSKHALAQMHARTQQNAGERRPLTNARAQVPHKTPLCTKESWHKRMHWHVCITIPQTLFVVNKRSLQLTPLN